MGKKYRAWAKLIKGWVVFDTHTKEMIQPRGTNETWPDTWAKKKADELNDKDEDDVHTDRYLP